MKPVRHSVLALGVCVWVSLGGAALLADTWRGTAPFCDGKCNPGERQIGVSSCGDGACCLTGHKALCSNNTQGCLVKETLTACYGVVMVCDNGHYLDLNQNWQSCGKYVCGVCLGFSTQSLSFRPSLCKQGFVWREAVADDGIGLARFRRGLSGRLAEI